MAMQLATISGKSSLAAAIRYALARMERLRSYLHHGILELDNEAAGRGIRAEAIFGSSKRNCSSFRVAASFLLSLRRPALRKYRLSSKDLMYFSVQVCRTTPAMSGDFDLRHSGVALSGD